jgi:hypothetical protein
MFEMISFLHILLLKVETTLPRNAYFKTEVVLLSYW